MKYLTVFSFALAVLLAPLATATPANASFDVTVVGKGPPMILIPGLACSGAVWDSTVAHFSERFECHVVSLAGFGGLPPCFADGPLLERVRDDLAGYIKDRHLEKPAVVGHSLGGFLTLALAAQHPDLVGKLVVVDGAPFLMGLIQPGATLADAKAAAATMRQQFDSTGDAASEQMIRSGAFTRALVASEADHARIVAWSLASDRTTVAQAMAEMYSSDLREDLARIQSPTLVLAAWIAYKPYVDHDRIEAAYRDQFSHQPDVKLSITDTARHFIMFDDPQWFFSEVERFLSPTSVVAAAR
jgi:pimeloyl-ACP methyl ester carboxylesterase